LRFFVFYISVQLRKMNAGGFMPQEILVVADMKGLAYNAGARRFLTGKIGACLRSPVLLEGGKGLSVREIANDCGLNMSQIAYFGTYAWRDLDALLKVRSAGGLAVVLNRGGDILNAAPVSLWTKSAWPIALLAAVFAKWYLWGAFRAVQISESPHNIGHLMLSGWEKYLAAGLARPHSSFRWNWTICPEGFKRAEK
jgi:hypothetical protein